jgi:hypothetical protein
MSSDRRQSNQPASSRSRSHRSLSNGRPSKQALAALFVAAVMLTVVRLLSHAQSIVQPSRGVTDPGVVTTRQTITPAGVQSVFDGRVYGIAFGGDGNELWVLTGRTRGGKSQLYQLGWLKNAVIGRWELDGTPAIQGLAFDPVRRSPLVGITAPAKAAANRAGGAVRLLARPAVVGDSERVPPTSGGASGESSGTSGSSSSGSSDASGTPPGSSPGALPGALSSGPSGASSGASTAGRSGEFAPIVSDLGRHIAGGPAVAAGADGRRRAVLPLVFENELAIVDARSGPRSVG